jgi:hypothetical protein
MIKLETNILVLWCEACVLGCLSIDLSLIVILSAQYEFLNIRQATQMIANQKRRSS